MVESFGFISGLDSTTSFSSFISVLMMCLLSALWTNLCSKTTLLYDIFLFYSTSIWSNSTCLFLSNSIRGINRSLKLIGFGLYRRQATLKIWKIIARSSPLALFWQLRHLESRLTTSVEVISVGGFDTNTSCSFWPIRLILCLSISS